MIGVVGSEGTVVALGVLVTETTPVKVADRFFCAFNGTLEKRSMSDVGFSITFV